MKNVTIHNDSEGFIEEICASIYTQYLKATKENDRFTFVLSGGNTPRGVFTHLASHYLDRINWAQVYFFWLDERCTAPNDLDSNYFMAHKYLLSKLEVVGGVFRIKGEIEKQKAALLYCQELKNFFRGSAICFDFILMGMGPDGHVASIFPGLERTPEAKEIAFFTKKRYGGYYRISLGLDIINAGKYNLLMLKGKEKIKVFKNRDDLKLLPKDYVTYSHVICLDHE